MIVLNHELEEEREGFYGDVGTKTHQNEECCACHGDGRDDEHACESTLRVRILGKRFDELVRLQDA